MLDDHHLQKNVEIVARMTNVTDLIGVLNDQVQFKFLQVYNGNSP